MPSEIDIYRQKLASDPLDITAFSALRNHYMRNGLLVELAELLENRAINLGAQAEAADLFHRAGELWIDRMGDLARGTTTLLRAVEVAPSHRGSAERLERIYREAGDYEAQLHILTRWVEGLETYEPGKESAALRSSLYQQIGEVWSAYYQRPDVAVTFFKRAAQADPTNVMAIYLAREIYQQAGNFDTAARLYEMEVSAEPEPDRKIALQRELAILHERDMGDLEGAIMTLKRALAMAPTNADVLYELGTAIMRRVDAGNEAGDDRKIAADAFHRLAQFSEADAALQYLDTALDLLPGHEGSLEMYASTCEATQAWHDLRLRLERCLDSMSDPREKIPVARRLGRLHLEKLGEKDRALSYFETLEEFGDQHDLDVIRSLKGDQPVPAARPSRPAPAAPTPAAQAAAPGQAPHAAAPEAPAPDAAAPAAPAEPAAPAPAPEAHAPEAAPAEPAAPAGPPIDEEQVAKLRADGEKLQKLGMADKAEAKMLQVLGISPDDAIAWAFVEKRFRATNRFVDLKDLLVRAAESPRLTAEHRMQRLREAAAIAETRLRDVEASVDVYRRMVALEPDNAETRKAFERILTSAKRWDDLVTYLEEETYRVSDTDRKYDLLQRIADIHLLRRDDPRGAYDIWWRVLEFRPDDKDVIGKLDELALRLRDWDELTKVLALQLEKEEDKDKRLAIFLRRLSLEDETMQNQAAAIETCRGLLEEFPGHVETLRRLARLEEATDDVDGLVQTLAKLIEVSGDDAEKAKALKVLAVHTWDRFDDADQACAYWQKYIERVPGDLEAYERYGGILEGTGREEELIALYRKLLADKSLEEHHREFMRRLGLLLSSEKVNRRAEAMEVWRKLLEGGDDIEALGTLAAWDREKERWPDLRDNLKRQANLAGDPAQKAAILKDLAEILYDQLKEPRAAIDALRGALEAQPGDRPALTALRVVLADIEDFAGAAAALEQELAIPMEADEEKQLLELQASWYREKLEDLPRAIQALERLLAITPGDPAVLEALDGLYEKQGEWEKLLRLLRSKTKAEENEAEKLGLLLRGARICEDKLNDQSRSWSWYKEIFSRIAVDEDVMSVIEEAAKRFGQWVDLASMYEDLAPRAETPDAQVVRWRQASAVYSEKIGDHERALYDVHQAVSANPDEVTLLDEADREALACKDWERLGSIYERISRGLGDEEARVMLLRRFAETVWRKGGFAQGAVGPLLRAVEEMPEDAALFEEFFEASVQAGEYKDLLAVFERRFHATTSNDERLEIKLRMARVWAEHLKNVDGAIKIIQEAVEVDPSNERFGKLIFEAARSVEANLSEGDRGYVYTWLLKTYQTHAESYEANDPVRVTFLRQVARIYREGLDDPPSAFNALREAHRLQPADLTIIESLESMAGQQQYWEALADHLAGILRLALRVEHVQLIHDRRARILAEELGRPEEAAEHYWQLIQMDPTHPTALRKLSDFYRSVGRFNDLLVILESALEKAAETGQKVTLMREAARVWDEDLHNRFEALDAYKRILKETPDDADAQAAIERLEKSKMGLAAKFGGGEEDEEEEAVDVESLRKSLLEEDFEDLKPGPKVPVPKSKPKEKDQLPDWETDVDTGEVPLQKVSHLLAMTRDGVEGEDGEGGGMEGEAPAVGEPAAEPAPAGPPPAEAPDAAQAAGDLPAAEPRADEAEPAAAEPPASPPADAIPDYDMDEGTPVDHVEEHAAPAAPPPLEPEPDAEKPARADASYVLDDANLGEMLEEEYAVDEVAKPSATPATRASQPPPLPAAKPRGKSDSLPPPPPPVKKRGAKIAPPPPPSRKKSR